MVIENFSKKFPKILPKFATFFAISKRIFSSEIQILSKFCTKLLIPSWQDHSQFWYDITVCIISNLSESLVKWRDSIFEKSTFPSYNSISCKKIILFLFSSQKFSIQNRDSGNFWSFLLLWNHSFCFDFWIFSEIFWIALSKYSYLFSGFFPKI